MKMTFVIAMLDSLTLEVSVNNQLNKNVLPLAKTSV